MTKTPRHHFKIASVNVSEKVFNSLPFGRQIEHLKAIQAFKESPDTKSTHFNQKGMTFAKGLKAFLALYNVKEYYTIDRNGPEWKDDSTEIWYTKNA